MTVSMRTIGLADRDSLGSLERFAPAVFLTEKDCVDDMLSFLEFPNGDGERDLLGSRAKLPLP